MFFFTLRCHFHFLISVFYTFFYFFFKVSIAPHANTTTIVTFCRIHSNKFLSYSVRNFSYCSNASFVFQTLLLLTKSSALKRITHCFLRCLLSAHNWVFLLFLKNFFKISITLHASTSIIVIFCRIQSNPFLSYSVRNLNIYCFNASFVFETLLLLPKSSVSEHITHYTQLSFFFVSPGKWKNVSHFLSNV